MFKTESSPPERGVNGKYVEFMMGHSGGIESVGGTYDRTPEIYSDVVEREYAKLEPYINIYSGRSVEDSSLGLSEEDVDALKILLQKMKEGKVEIRD